MKTKEIIFIVEESLEGGYEARAVGESIFTEADNIDELKKILPKQFDVILMRIIFRQLSIYAFNVKK